MKVCQRDDGKTTSTADALVATLVQPKLRSRVVLQSCSVLLRPGSVLRTQTVVP